MIDLNDESDQLSTNHETIETSRKHLLQSEFPRDSDWSGVHHDSINISDVVETKNIRVPLGDRSDCEFGP